MALHIAPWAVQLSANSSMSCVGHHLSCPRPRHRVSHGNWLNVVLALVKWSSCQ